MRSAAEAMVEALFVVDRKLGVFSLWKGQQALNSRPARTSFTEGPITLDRSVRARSSSRKAGLKVMGDDAKIAPDSHARKRARATYPQKRTLERPSSALP